MIYVFTGNGQGKTTASLGFALRKIGEGKKVVIIQFMKGRKTGEHITIEKFLPGCRIYQFGREEFVDLKNPLSIDKNLAEKGFIFAQEILKSHPEVIILDEINIAVHYGLIDKNKVVDFIKGIPVDIDLILTGRYAPSEFIKIADVVTEMKDVKH